VLGYLYNFCMGGRIHAYQSGFDDADPKRRPGALCQAAAIEHNAAKGESLYDFLAGENQLKASYSTDRYELAWQVVRLPRFKFRLESTARRVKQALFGPR
jgi:CelD/BcsL family acetyltransferase involved in cellulose biosynthesis